ncbi:MAG: flagellar basal-body MS-ring/collar protein FliF [Gemmatimonas sp.]
MLESIIGRSVSPRQIAIIGVGVVVTALVFGLSTWAAKPVKVPLFAGLPITSVSDMTAKLTEVNIPYELDETGTTISVSTADQAKARVELAKAGLPNAGRPGMELFDKPTWGMTDFTQKVNYGRALEGELVKTIASMRDVKSVQVHLALEDESLFKQNERPSKASVTIAMKGGESPQQSVVTGIQSLVAGSIGGLDPQHVTVLDESGHALASDDDGSVASQTSRHLTVQHELEASLQKKAENILQSLVGTGNSKVQVNASLNFDKIERTTKQIDPEKQGSVSEQKAEVTPSSPQQGAGYSTTASSFENSSSVESFVGTIGTLKKLTVAVLVADKVTIPPADSTKKGAQEPIITTRTPEEITRIESLMRNALGVDSTRGDMISVVSAPFNMPPADVARDTSVKQSFLTRVENNPKPYVWVSALVGLLVLAVVMVIALKPKKASASAAQSQLGAASSYPELPASTHMASAMQAQQHQHLLQQSHEEFGGIEQAPRQVVLPAIAVSPEREQAIATVDQRPDAAVRVTRNWLRA